MLRTESHGVTRATVAVARRAGAQRAPCGATMGATNSLNSSPVSLPREREREIVLGKTRHTQFVSYTSRGRAVPRVDPHARVRSSMVGAPVRLPPRTRVTTLHTSLNQRIQSTKPSGTTSSPSAQGGTRRIQEAAIRARGGGVCHICREVTCPSITEGVLGCSGP
jgi:hypothetical protein